MSLSHKNLFNNTKGGALFIAMIGISVLTISGYYTMDFLDKMDVSRRNLDLNIKARLIAEDALEASKYLFFYEKIVSLDTPQVIPASWRSFSDASSNLNAWIETCGDLSFGPSSPIPTTFMLNSERVFCPVDLRDFRVSGDIYEVQLEKFSGSDYQPDSPIEMVDDGIFKVGPFKFTTETLAGAWLDFGLEGVTKGRIKDIEVNLFIHTKKSGFISVDSERFIKIESTVTYGLRNSNADLTTSVSDSFILRATSMKEFAAFIGYPYADTTGFWKESSAKTTTFQEHFKLNKNSNFYGKVYFREGFDFDDYDFTNATDTEVPFFNDMVLFSGLPEGVIPAPTKDNIAKLSVKFKKGFLFGLDADYLFDSPNNSNKTGGMNKDINFFGPGDTYINKRAECIHRTDSSQYVVINLKDDDSSDCTSSDVGRWGGNMVPAKGGRIKRITVNNEMAFIMAAAGNLNIAKNNASIYGVYMGGKITGNQKVDFYALPNLRVGLTGIENTNRLSTMAQQANSTFELIGVPFINVPMIIKGQQ